MKFFATRSQFAAKLLAVAGFDFEALFKTADENALKALIDGKVSAVKPDAAALTTAKAEGVKELLAAAKLTVPEGTEPAAFLAALAGAQAENTQLEKTLGEITEGRAALAATLTPLTAALESNGLKLEAFNDAQGAFSADKFTTGFKSRISVKARELVAASGGPILDEEVSEDATAKAGSKKTMSRAEFSKLTARAQADFCALVSSGKAILAD